MPVVFANRCPDCGTEIHYVYDVEEAEFRTDTEIGCPGEDCTTIHDVTARTVDEDKAKRVEEMGHKLS